MSMPTTRFRRPVSLLAGLALVASGLALAFAAQSASAATGPSLTVTPSGGLDPAGTSVRISGSGFSTANPGIYVGVAATDKYNPTNAGAFGAVKYVHTGATPSAGQDVLTADGTFSTTLSFAATFGTGANATNCLTSTCAIYTMAAQGSPDRSQDAVSVIHFQNSTLVVTPTTGVDNGALIAVTGSGFTPSKGIYLAESTAKPVNGPPSAYTGAKWIQSVDANGAFSSTLTAADVFTPQGSTTAIDCRAVQCYVASFNDHTDIMNRSQDVWVPITFAPATVTPEPTPTTPEPMTSVPTTSNPTATPTTTAPTTTGPAVTVTPATDLDPTGATVTVTGGGFSASDPGIYVGIASVAKFSTSSMDGFGATKWVHLGATASAGQTVLNGDGSFSVTLGITPTFGTGAGATDCLHEQCAIFTFAAHGSSDRSQDTSTPIAFTGAVISPTASTSPVATSAGSASGSAALASVPPGGQQTVTGEGFAPGELVQATLHSTPVDLGTFTANANGTVVVSFTVPSTVALGSHSVTLTGLTSARTTSATFSVADATVLAAGTTTLANTGASTHGLGWVAVACLALGMGLVFLGRRPRTAGRRHG
jgi:hypothetical protein